VIAVFLTAIGLLMWVFPETSVLEYGYADMDTLFSMGPFVLIFLVPAITMKSFAEEKKLGTLELLFTMPLSDWAIVFGKFLAGFSLILLALLPTLVYYFSIASLGNPVGNIDTPGVIGSYIGITLLGGVFCSIGIFASAITGLDSLSTLSLFGSQALMVEQFGILYHYKSMSKGLIDSRDLIYFLSITGLMLLFTKIIVSRHS
jgi:ABC-2 type transport system permease protein